MCKLRYYYKKMTLIKIIVSLYFIVCLSRSLRIERGSTYDKILTNQSKCGLYHGKNSSDACDCKLSKPEFASLDGEKYQCTNLENVCKNSGLIAIPKEGFNISVPCSKVWIKNISVWNFVSSEANEKRGKWFDITSNVIAEFPVEDKFILFNAGLHNKWEGQLLRIDFQNHSCLADCQLFKFIGQIDYPYNLTRLNYVAPTTAATVSGTVTANSSNTTTTKNPDSAANVGKVPFLLLLLLQILSMLIQQII